jgi:SAM-dependent methyltransferase
VHAAFDAAAASYDAEFTHTPIARQLRQTVWQRLDANFQPGMTVLELGCGTGEDAIHLAQRGVQVIATDASHAMLAATRAKAVRANLAGRIETRWLDMNGLPAASGDWPLAAIAGVFSNVGPINCVADPKTLAWRLAEWTRPHARMIFVAMGRFCLWEIGWHLAHWQPRIAFRRWARSGALANVGGASIHVHYPTPARLARDFAPAFRVRRIAGLGVFLPPPFVRRIGRGEPGEGGRPTEEWPLAALSVLEQRLAARWPFKGLGDHTIVEFERVHA